MIACQQEGMIRQIATSSVFTTKALRTMQPRYFNRLDTHSDNTNNLQDTEYLTHKQIKHRQQHALSQQLYYTNKALTRGYQKIHHYHRHQKKDQKEKQKQ